MAQPLDLNDVKYQSVMAILNGLAKTSSNYMALALKALMTDSKVSSHVSDGIMPYIYAAGLLSFAGKEITDANLAKLVTVIGVKPDQEMIGILMESGVKSHVVYIYSFYFLIASNTPISVEKIMETVSELGIVPDKELATKMKAFCELALKK